VLRRAVGTDLRRRRAGVRVAVQMVGTAKVGAQALDVELREDAPRRGYV
jgi:hypothetical protein